ncbi:TPA: aspartate-semialdehyde dehydrogenase [bacterium]|nr:aspartate-semialdehyde dehydrogenase [bacterium]
MKVAVAGATGSVGCEMMNVLEKRDFPVSEILLLASERSSGKKLKFKGEEIEVKTLKEDSFKGCDIALFSAGKKVSLEFARYATSSGCLVIDNSSAFRMDKDIPLVIPEINQGDIALNKGIIANPNCTTIIMCLPLWPIHKRFRAKRVVVATYQAASGAGMRAMNELLDETKAVLLGESYERKIFPFQYAFNLFPHNSPMMDNGYCEEENKMVFETRKIFHEENFNITATCVRVPVLRAHSEAINIELEEEASVDEIYEVLKEAPGVKILEDRPNNRWPMPIDASCEDEVFVGRIRKDPTQRNSFWLWIVGDQLLKGAALNAVQIAEYVIK